ncbi:MAG: hypothetical protein QOE70_2559 [Chthoniobacter sp.]|jgi:ABC-type Na+ efflux pump permease subunit|nr:hypothetical protein [Chthoniobacter sp.]
MTSPLLALFARSLRDDVRLKITYFARVGLILVILLFLLSVRQSYGYGNAPGLEFFENVVYINFFFILLAGFSYFASAITEEKEEMTLGLLRMTNLNPLSILLGKSTSRLIGALLLLLAQFPFTLLAISLGGVAMRQILAAYCTLGAFLIFLSNLALLASVIFRRTTAAAFMTGLTLFVFFALVPFLRWLVMVPISLQLVIKPSPLVVKFGEIADAVALASPLDRLEAILATGFNDSPAGAQVWSNLVLGAGCFLLAWAVFEIFCSEQQEAAPGRNLVARRNSLFRGLGAGRAWQRSLAWKDFYFLTGGKVWMAAKFILYPVPIVIFILLPRPFRHLSMKELGYFAFYLAFFVGCIELAFAAGSVFRQERRWKTLSSLAMLPMSMRRIAWQKILGCLPALLPALCYFAVAACFVQEEIRHELHRNGRWDTEALAVMGSIAAQFLFFLHLVAFLSLHVKRGALPVAIAIQFVGNLFAGIALARAFRDESGFVVVSILLGVATVVLHVQTGRRLEALAEED